MDDLIWSANSFGDVIRRAREQKGLTQKELAELYGDISAMYISQIERGERVPSMKVCRRLAEALGLNTKRLLLLAYRATAPKEIQELLVDGEPIPFNHDEDLNVLFRVIYSLPEDQKRKVLNAMKGLMRLVVEDFDIKEESNS